MNFDRIAGKLQRALLRKGRMIKINRVQMYSDRRNAMLTRYSVIEAKVMDGKIKNVTLLETFQMREVVMLLRDMYGGG